MDSHINPFRDLIWPEIYDTALIALMSLGEAERILRQSYNSTLSEWTTETLNFKEKGDFIVNVLKQAVGQIKIHGMAGFYGFDSETMKNLNGFQPIVFFQVRFNNVYSSDRVLVSYFHESKLNDMNGGFLFSNSKVVPSDKVVKIDYEVAIIDDSLYVIFCILAVAGIFISLFFFMLTFLVKNHLVTLKRYLTFRLKSFPVEDMVILIGLIVIQGSLFSTPNGTRNLGISLYWMFYSILLTTGFSILTTGFLLKTIKAKTFCTRQRPNGFPCVYFCWPVLQLGLILALVGIGTFDRLEKTHLPRHHSDEKSIAYLPYQYRFKDGFLFKDKISTLGIVFAIVSSNALHLFYIIYNCYTTLKLLSATKFQTTEQKVVKLHDFQMTVTAAYCFAIVILGITMIAIVLGPNIGSLVILISFSVIVCSFIFLIVIFSTKFIPREIVIFKPPRYCQR